MVLENKLNITDQVELARTEEKFIEFLKSEKFDILENNIDNEIIAIEAEKDKIGYLFGAILIDNPLQHFPPNSSCFVSEEDYKNQYEQLTNILDKVKEKLDKDSSTEAISIIVPIFSEGYHSLCDNSKETYDYMKGHNYDYDNFWVLRKDNKGDIKRVNSLWYPPITGWVSHFDIEGFGNKLEKNIEYVKESLGTLLPAVEAKLKEFKQRKKDEYKIYFNYYQDTFIFYSRTEDNVEENKTPFVLLVDLSIWFYKECLKEDLILMGAISYGDIILSTCHKFFFGKAFLEAKSICDNKEFFKLLLAKSAVDQLMNMLPKKNYKEKIGNFVNLLADKKLEDFIENHDHTYVYNFCGFYFGDGYMNGKKNKHYNPTIREAFKRNKPNEEGCEKIKKRYETTLQFINTVTELMAKY